MLGIKEEEQKPWASEHRYIIVEGTFENDLGRSYYNAVPGEVPEGVTKISDGWYENVLIARTKGFKGFEKVPCEGGLEWTINSSAEEGTGFIECPRAIFTLDGRCYVNRCVLDAEVPVRNFYSNKNEEWTYLDFFFGKVFPDALVCVNQLFKEVMEKEKEYLEP
jgi:hypothetical protein